MSTQIEIFSNPEFGNVRVVASSEGEPLFCLADVCNVLDIQNPSRVANEILDDDLRFTYPLHTAGGIQNATFTNEAGLYSIILRSNKPEAKKFRKWVTSEVLPAIRKHGGYLTKDKIEEALLNPDTLIQLATSLKAEREARQRIEAQNARNEARLKEQAPKVGFANAILASTNNCLVGELAKIISQNGKQIGQNKLFSWLRQHGYLGTKGERYNQPNQRYIEQGLFFIKKGVRNGNAGVLYNISTTTVTPKGQAYFIGKILEGGIN